MPPRRLPKHLTSPQRRTVHEQQSENLPLVHNSASEAADFYASVLPDTHILSQDEMSMTLSIGAQQLILFNGGPHHSLSSTVSLLVSCADQAEIDSLWGKLKAQGGKKGQCGWLTDRFGLAWQIVPGGLAEPLGSTPGWSRR